MTKCVVTVVVTAALLSVAAPGMACSPAAPQPVFSYRRHPDYPIQPFVAGRLGIVLPTWNSSYLVLAYRHLTGIGLDPAEQQALLALWEQEQGPLVVGKTRPKEWMVGAVGEWYRARSDVGNGTTSVTVDRYRPDYSSFVNCLDDAFLTAAATLRTRAAHYGPGNPIVKEWLSAQDQVFLNCGGDPMRGHPRSIPQPLAQVADPLVAADRDYQIAGAMFYSGDFDEAANAFRRIASTPSSPWRVLARHLVARCLIRKATLQSEGFDRAGLEAAQGELRAIVTDPALRDAHAASQRLLRFVRIRLEPKVFCQEVAEGVTRQHAGSALARDLKDYASGCWFSEPTDDLTQWIRALRAGENTTAEALRASVASSLDQWRKRRQPHWLLAALVTSAPDDPHLEEALDAARAFDDRLPAAPTLAFHVARLELDRGDIAIARARLDRLIAQGEERLGRSSYNLALDLRRQAALDLDDLLRHISRRPAGWVEPDYSADEPAIGERDEALRLDDTTAAVLSWLPLSVQVEAVMGEALPQAIRVQLGGAAWVKAIALGEDDTSLRIAQRLVDLRPEARRLLGAYLRAPDTAGRSREALLLLLRRTYPPILLPLQSLVGAVSPPPGKQLRWNEGWDSGQRAWWCGVGHRLCTCPPPAACSGCEPLWAWERILPLFPAFLDERQRAQVRSEWQRLETVGSGPEFLCARAMEWAESDPKDPRVPEALHRAVAASQWACESDRLGALSQRAFRILHRRYGSTPWAQKTKYWYRGR